MAIGFLKKSLPWVELFIWIAHLQSLFNVMTDLSGTWLGTYWQNNEPTRFEASLVQGAGTLSGNILDDGHLGEAIVAGEVMGRQVSFTKRYVSGKTQEVVTYTGKVSESGNSMEGTWAIEVSQGRRKRDRLSGTWEAHRNGDSLMQELMRRVQQQVPVGAGAR